MFEAIGAAIFVLIVAFALWYCSMYLMYLLWNNKYARKARKDAIEAMINAEKFIERYREYEEINYEFCKFQKDILSNRRRNESTRKKNGRNS